VIASSIPHICTINEELLYPEQGSISFSEPMKLLVITLFYNMEHGHSSNDECLLHFL
jgi:hypothetical protein